MAKLMIELDTETGTIDVSVDGTKVKNVDYFSGGMYPDYDAQDEGEKDAMKCGFNIYTKTMSDNGVKSYTSICASKSPEGKISLALGAKQSEIPGCVENLVEKNPFIPNTVKAVADKTLQNVKKFIKGAR